MRVAEARPFADVRSLLLERSEQQRHPFTPDLGLDPALIAATLAGLESVEPQAWVEAFAALAAPHEAKGAIAERAGDSATASREYLAAYAYWRVARYPAPTSAAKREAYRSSQQMYLKASYWWDPPLERVWMLFDGKRDEGQFVIGDLRKPRLAAEPVPVVVHWGGIDSYKEERRAEPFLAAGLASLAIDMPGVGDAPLDGSPTAERQWDAVFDWIASRPDLDANRVAVLGAGTGGYWAAKLAHTHRDRFARGGRPRWPGPLRVSSRLDRPSPNRRVPVRAGRDAGRGLRWQVVHGLGGDGAGPVIAGARRAGSAERPVAAGERRRR